jgi:hypothetical protein
MYLTEILCHFWYDGHFYFEKVDKARFEHLVKRGLNLTSKGKGKIIPVLNYAIKHYAMKTCG